MPDIKLCPRCNHPNPVDDPLRLKLDVVCQHCSERFSVLPAPPLAMPPSGEAINTPAPHWESAGAGCLYWMFTAWCLFVCPMSLMGVASPDNPFLTALAFVAAPFGFTLVVVGLPFVSTGKKESDAAELRANWLLFSHLGIIAVLFVATLIADGIRNASLREKQTNPPADVVPSPRATSAR